MFENYAIPNDRLRPEDLPEVNADWDTINPFALTFDGYTYWGSFERCAEMAERVQRRYIETGELPDDLVELRTTLFFAQRGARFRDSDPSPEDMRLLWALIEAMRRQLQA